MPMWRCPHCGTPQPEAARCWVCRRSSTTCSTCRQFRRAVAGRLGYCGLDRRRTPISGLELRGCWEGADAVAGPAIGASVEAPPAWPRDRFRRDFVPVGGPDSAPLGLRTALIVLEPTEPGSIEGHATLFDDRA